jgi:hypothetical protein
MRSDKILKIIAVLIVLSFVFFSGCTSLSGDDKSVTPASESQSTPSYSYSGDVSDAGKVTGTTSSYNTAPGLTGATITATTGSNVYTNLSGRKVINTASVQMETSDHDKTVSSVRSITTASGGYVESSRTWVTSSNKKHTSITVKVPQSAFQSDLSQMEALGSVKSESISGQDVTRQYIDLSARISNLQAEEKQLNSFMGMAKNVSEVLAVTNQLYSVRAEIESDQAQLNYLGSQVDFATITVEAYEPEPVVGYDWGIGDAFRDASHGFVGMIGGLIVLTGYLIPLVLYFIIAAAILYFVAKFALGYYKKRQMKKENK